MPDLARLGRNAARALEPFTSGLEDILEGPNHTFFVPTNCGWSGLEIEHLLDRYGVRVWGRQVIKDHIMFTVREPQARWAQYLLDRYGIPLADGSAYLPPRRSAPTGHPFWRRLTSLFSQALRELLDDLGV